MGVSFFPEHLLVWGGGGGELAELNLGGGGDLAELNLILPKCALVSVR